uniref:Uncharacterized protein n=1 Tax=Strongyloides venezuelensis TaxID=75913 RepID=A0A0K0FXD6_STRVS
MNFINLVSLFILIIQPCGNSNCPPILNHAFVVYIIEPNSLFTYNTVDYLSREHQYSTWKGLRDGLILMDGGVL